MSHPVSLICQKLILFEGDPSDWASTSPLLRQPASALEALEELKGRFPAWMWRNSAFVDFISWLKEENERRAATARAPVFLVGLDIYSMYRAAQHVVEYLDRVDKSAAAAARDRYAALALFGGAAEQEASARYVRALQQGLPSQADHFAAILSDLLSKETPYSALKEVKKSRFSHMWRPPSLCVFPYVSG